MARGGNWIKGAIKHPGAYGHHSQKQMQKDASRGGKIGKRANLALTLANLRKKKKG